MRIQYIFGPLLCWLLYTSLHAQTCPPTDPAFGQLGRVYGPGTFTSRILVQPDQKVIHAGYFQTYATEPYLFVQRFLDDGKPDLSFGYQGIAIIKSGGLFAECQDAFLQDDGRILLCGPYMDAYAGRVLGMMRLLPDGRPDSSFGKNGIIYYPGIKLYDRFSVSGVDSDGRILLTGSMAGVASLCSYPEVMYPVSAAVRLRENGKIDSSYGQQGIVKVDMGNFSDQGKAGVLLPSGQLITATLTGKNCGCLADYYWGEYWYCGETYLKLTRYNTDGRQDSGFALYDPQAGSPNPLDIVGMYPVQGGKMIAIGSTVNEFILFGFQADGRPDPGFGNNGKVIIDPGSLFSNYASLEDAIVRPDGRILLLGNVDGQSFVLALRENGQVDTSFYGTGRILFELDGRWSYANTLATHGDNVLVGGQSSRPVLTRLMENPDKIVPLITANGPLAFCLGDSVRLSTNLSGSYAWFRDGSQIGVVQSIRATAGGIYRVMVSNADGCGVSDPTSITVYTPPVFYGIQWNGSQMSVDSGYVRYVWYRDNIVVDSTSGFRYNPGTNIGAYTVRVWDRNGCISLSSPFNYVVTGIADIRIGDAELRLYPNPVRTGLNIYLNQASGTRMTADIVDMSGRLLQRVVLRQGRNEVPMLPYRAGVYAVVLRYGKEQTVRKVLLVK